ncbi:thiamine phosphate synthase [Allosphingosinicella sp.]|jgi:thiamine-phosphate pyrophosphorylase|uniref:thiamine phosphate synthase n=1 Tax=Allosphingosinicella sp. TaxID=2823234 RepID=UPI002F152FCD
MPRRQPLPRLWMMTDERQSVALFGALDRLPEGSGLVFRHYSLPAPDRRSLFDRVAAIARRRGLLLLLAGPAEEAAAWGADGSHGRGPGGGLRTAAAHDLKEIRAAEEALADLVFLSPVFRTRSHPDRPPLGPPAFAALARATCLPVVALGGMDSQRFLELEGAYGWAGIDAWTGA